MGPSRRPDPFFNQRFRGETMTLAITAADWRAIFPHAPDDIIAAFVAQIGALDRVGITETRTRLAYTLANAEHECGGFTITDLTENIGYTAERLAEVFPKRFADAAAVRARFGTAKGWQRKAFDEIYGGRMGNRLGTDDGSRFIGRGCPQITGRDGYEQVGSRCGLDLVGQPRLATLPQHQPAILAAFCQWKNILRWADKGDFPRFVHEWNGGENGMADRRERLAGNDPIIARLRSVTTMLPALDRLV